MRSFVGFCTLALVTCAVAAPSDRATPAEIAATAAWMTSAAERPVDPNEVAVADVPRDLKLFLLVGQSNMAGRGVISDDDRPAPPNCLKLNRDGVWVRATSPIHYDRKTSGYGIADTFARRYLAEHPGETVGLIPCAVGGSLSSTWSPENAPDPVGTNFRRAVARAKVAQRNGTIVGILWHQGESDIGRFSKDPDLKGRYAARLTAIAKAFRDELKCPDAPFLAGEIGTLPRTCTAMNPILREAVRGIPNAGLVPAADLTGHLPDGIHFDTASYKILGARYYEMWKSLRGTRGSALKVLAIGNSFTQSTWQCLPAVAKDCGCELDYAIMEVGGWTFDRHIACLTNAANVQYDLLWSRCGDKKAMWPELAALRKDGERTDKKTGSAFAAKGYNLKDVLKAVAWDVVVLQQSSDLSWKLETIRSGGEELCKAIKTYSPRSEIVLQETWSYTPYDKRLAVWKLDQNSLYSKIHRAYCDFASSHGSRVIPMGAAVQLWRERMNVTYSENSLGGDVCGQLGPKRDDHHLNGDGWYLQGLVWTAKLFGADVTTCRYAPEGMPPERAQALREVARAAVRGEPVPVTRGGCAIPPSVAKGLAAIRAAGVKDGEIVELDYRPGSLRVGYVLRPTTKSYIRCELGLPDPEKWDGRLWGWGNGGWAGKVHCPRPTGGSADVTTDMGTSRHAIGENPVEIEVLRDFGVRSTHLMTVEAKRLVEAYYGRRPHHSYFCGGSTGGGQGMCETQRFPEDYDGVIAEVPAHDRLPRATGVWQDLRLREKYGKCFSKEQQATVLKAERDYFAAKDPEIARGRFIWNPEPTKENLDGCWKAIVAADPSLAGHEAYWRGLFADVVIDGRRLAPGQVIGREFNPQWTFLLEKFTGPRSGGRTVTAKEMLDFADNRDCRFVNPDLSAFARRGGKLITYAGLSDECVPPRPITEYFDAVARQCGGVDKARRFMLHYLIPGRMHCTGKDRAHGFTGRPNDLNSKLVDWVEKGIRPDELTVPFIDTAESIVIRPYAGASDVRAGETGAKAPSRDDASASLKKARAGLDPAWADRLVEVVSTYDKTPQPCYFWKSEKADREEVPLMVGVHTWSGNYRQIVAYRGAFNWARTNGWAFVGPNFRGSNDHPLGCGSDAAVQDIVDAIEYAKAHARIDPRRIYISGGSGGGHISLLTASRHPDLFAGVAAFCPITDLARWHADSRLAHPGRNKGYADMLERACGGTPAARPDEYAHRSPLTFLSALRAAGVPVYLGTGIHDGWRGSVPVGHVIRAYNRLADDPDRLSEEAIAAIEATQTVPAELAFAGSDPLYGKKMPIHLRKTSANVRLTIFEGGHDGNYRAGFDFLSRQTKGRPADFTLPQAVSVSLEKTALTK